MTQGGEYSADWRFDGWALVLLPTLVAILLGLVLVSIDAVATATQARIGYVRAVAPLLAREAGRVSAAHGDLNAFLRETLNHHTGLAQLRIVGAGGETLHAATHQQGDGGVLGAYIGLLSEPEQPVIEPLNDRTSLEVTPWAPQHDPRLRSWLAGLLLGLVALLIVSLLICWYVIAALSARQRRLARIAAEAASGRLEVRAPRQSGVSGRLADAINRMASQLTEARDRHRDQVDRETGKLRAELARTSSRVRAAQEALEIAERTAQARGDLLANMTHELRTPLSAMVGHAELLARHALPPESAEEVQTLRSSAQALLELVNDLLDWSRIEAGKLTLHEQEIDLGDTVEEIVEFLAPLAYEKELELVPIVYHDVPARLRGDAGRLRQIMTNLLSNAIKYTERGEVVMRVMKERETPQTVTLCISVSDTGVGIPADMQKRLFEPYQRAAQAGGPGGTGLGLAITRRLVERMNGSVTVESTPGLGSTFSAVITLGVPAVLTPSPRLEGLRGLLIWLYEPHRTAQLALLHLLEYWGITVRVFETASQLTASLQHAVAERQPDLLILGLPPRDLQDPAVGDLLAAGKKSGVPVIGLLSSVSRQHHEHLRAAGAADSLPKSIARRSLYDALGEVAGRLAPTAQRESPLADRRVLVADNNLANRRFIATLLQGLGADVIEAHDGLTAVAAWHARQPEFLLLDIHMPGLDGLAAAREIRSREGAARKAVILGISAHLEDEERRALALSGMDGELLKPFDGRQLLRALSPWLRLPGVSLGGEKPDALVSDPQLRRLLAEELPTQLRELEDAYAKGDSQALRAAVHQLHGTAAFYRLRQLKQAAAAMEHHLAQPGPVTQHPRLRDDISAVRSAVLEALRDLRQSGAMEPLPAA